MSGEVSPLQDPQTERVPLTTRLRRQLARLRTVALVVAAAGLAVVVYRWAEPIPTPLTSAQVHSIALEAMASATPGPAFSAEVYRAILPSLVLIQTRGGAHGEDQGLGSGVIIDLSGDILTAFHVVDGASSIQLTFADGTQASASVASSSPDIDIAVLTPDGYPQVIVPATLGSLNSVRVGDEAYAVGNPFGLPESMSAGVISGFNRSVNSEDGKRRLTGLIQFDAAVNPGNSGGPLLNRRGQVIGIVTGLANPADERFFVGVGLAVPIPAAAAAAGAPPY